MKMIIVNGKRKRVDEGPITHSRICTLAHGPADQRAPLLKDDEKLEVSWINGTGKDGKGSIKPGGRTDPKTEQDFLVSVAPKKGADKKDD